MIKNEAFNQFLNKDSSVDILFFNFNQLSEFSKIYETDKYQTHYYRSFLSQKDYDAIDDQAYFLSRNWFKELDISNYLKYKDIIIPDVDNLQIAKFLINVFAIVRALKNFKSNRIYKSILIYSNDNFFIECANKYLSLFYSDIRVIFNPKIKIKALKQTFSFSNYFGFINKIKNRNGKKVIIFQPHFSINPIIEKLEACGKYKTIDIYSASSSFIIRLKYKIIKLFPILAPVLTLKIKLAICKIDKKVNTNKFNNITYFDEFNWFANLKKDFFEILLNSYIDICKSIDNTEYIVNKYSPSMFITATFVTPIQRIIFIFANKNKIPVLAMLHGLLSTIRRSSDIIYSDFLAIWGPKDKEYFESLHQRNINRCVLAGNPQYDIIFNELDQANIKEKVMSDLEIPTNKKIIVFVSNYALPFSAYDGNDVIEWGLNLFHDFLSKYKKDDIYAIIKRHPMDNNDKLYSAFYSMELEKKVKIVKQYSFLDLISASDFVITFPFSTAGLDAIALKKPFILIRLFDFPYEIPYIEYGTTEYANNAEEMMTNINLNLLEGLTQEKLKAYDNFYKDFAFYKDGLSNQRIVDFIKSKI
jgi:hypothetical protein